MARFNLNRERLAPVARELAAEAGLELPCTNPFKSIVIRAIEVLHACDEAVRIIEKLRAPRTRGGDVRAGRGDRDGMYGSAARHALPPLRGRGGRVPRYGADRTADIAEPGDRSSTTLRDFVEANLDLSDRDLKWRCEQSIRNYDPCISCATHFLKFDIERAGGNDA